jgi:phosphoribosylformylglycinamidine synthase
MWEVCRALRDCLLQLGVGVDGGKDSLTMAAKVRQYPSCNQHQCHHSSTILTLQLCVVGEQVGDELVRSPGQVTLTCYAACPDITGTVTPDLKHPGEASVHSVCHCCSTFS